MINQELVRKIAYLERRLDNLAKPEAGWTPHFLTTAYTNANFNGDSFSDVAANTKIENTDWSTTIPSDAKALMIYGQCRDSGSAATADLFFNLYTTAGGSTAAFAMTSSGAPNDSSAYGQAVVPCTDGDVWYKCAASGADTMDVWLYCWGWWS